MKKILLVSFSIVIFLSSSPAGTSEEISSSLQAPPISKEKEAIIDRAIQSLQSVYNSKEAAQNTGKDIEYWQQIKLTSINYFSDIPLSSEEEVKKFILGMALSGDAIQNELKLRRIVIHEINGKVNGIAVPPAPDKETNDATVAGIDTNSNGVRDDVERFIAQRFGMEKDVYGVAIKSAQSLQVAITEKSPSQEERLDNKQSGMENADFGPAVREYIAMLACMSDSELKVSDEVTFATLNTGIRRKAYGTTFAGTSMGSCP